METTDLSSEGENADEKDLKISSFSLNSPDMPESSLSDANNNFNEMGSDKDFTDESSKKKNKMEEDKYEGNGIDSGDSISQYQDQSDMQYHQPQPSSNNDDENESLLSKGESIKLINIDENGKFSITQEGQKFLESIEMSVALVCVAGAYRSGKSFLCSKMVGNTGGFKIGHTTKGLTKGIWVWSITKTIQVNGEDVSVIYCDTEGLYEIGKHKTNSDSIFVLTLLISSYLIINDKSHIQESTIEKLSIVTNLAKMIKLNANEKEEDRPETLAKNFPYLMWLLRDKHLNYTHIKTDEEVSVNEYFESCLEENPEDYKEENNMIRRLLQQYFPKRGCIAMDQPTDTVRDLQRLDSSDISINPIFLDQVKQLMLNIEKEIVPKTFNNEIPMNGVMLTQFIEMIIATINDNGEFCIAEAYDSAINYSWSKIESFYVKQMEQKLEEESEAKLKALIDVNTDFNNRKKVVLSQFTENENEYYVKRFKLNLAERIDSMIDGVVVKYQEIWHTQCEEIALEKYKEFRNTFERKSRENNLMPYQDIVAFVGQFEESYLSDAPEGTNRNKV